VEDDVKSLKEWYDTQGWSAPENGALSVDKQMHVHHDGSMIQYYKKVDDRERRRLLVTMSQRKVRFAIEVGCGETSKIKLLCGEVTHSIEVDVSMSALLRLKNRNPSLVLVQADAYHLPFKDTVADIVICHHLLYHLADLTRALTEFSRCLIPNGINHNVLSIGPLWMGYIVRGYLERGMAKSRSGLNGKCQATFSKKMLYYRSVKKVTRECSNFGVVDVFPHMLLSANLYKKITKWKALGVLILKMISILENFRISAELNLAQYITVIIRKSD